MTRLHDIPVRVESAERQPPDFALVNATLKEITIALECLVATGKSAVIVVRAMSRMSADTYQCLRDALSVGEVTASVEAQVRVEASETRYPGVWWLTYRNQEQAIVTEVIEIAEIPAILKAHMADMRAGLARLEEVLVESASNNTPQTS
jgi:hydrogenase-1 operon protein HyaF